MKPIVQRLLALPPSLRACKRPVDLLAGSATLDRCPSALVALPVSRNATSFVLGAIFKSSRHAPTVTVSSRSRRIKHSRRINGPALRARVTFVRAMQIP